MLAGPVFQGREFDARQRSMSMMPDDHLNAIVERLRNADNIPYVATMTPIVSELAASMPSHIHPDVLWWTLALRADFGGNLTAVGASANVVIIGIARRAGHPISFWHFTRNGALVTTMSIAMSAIYLALRHFMLA